MQKEKAITRNNTGKKKNLTDKGKYITIVNQPLDSSKINYKYNK